MTVTQFDWPMGTEAERKTHDALPGLWVDATPYGRRYNATGKWAVHTGGDFNLHLIGQWDADAHSPIYAIADGWCVFAGWKAVWGQLVITKHALEDGTPLWARYAHVEKMKVKYLDQVVRGQQLAQVGNADGRYPYHLHFDIARIDLGLKPADWPGDDLARVQRDYLNPLDFIRTQSLARKPGIPPNVVTVTADRLNVRDQPAGKIIGVILGGRQVQILSVQEGWGRTERGWINLKYVK